MVLLLLDLKLDDDVWYGFVLFEKQCPALDLGNEGGFFFVVVSFFFEQIIYLTQNGQD